jgi:uncharacterized protein (TIGR00156 family)
MRVEWNRRNIIARRDSMKVALSAVALGITVATAHADPSTGGYKGPDGVTLVTVAEANEMSDDSVVKLQGYIVKSLGDERYEFKDDSGTIVVEIDDEDWRGVEAGPSDRVELRGEVDREWKTTELDVDSVQLAP